jgi:hypothetical protein
MDPKDLLAQILAAQSGAQINPAAMAATQQGVSRTDLAALLNPALMTSLGLNDPYRIAAGLDPAFEQARERAIRQYEQEQQRIVAGVVRPPELDLNNVLPKYFSPNYQDFATDIANLFALIDEGYDASSAQIALDNLVSSKPELEQYGQQLRTDLERYQKEREVVAEADRKYQRDLLAAQQQIDVMQQPELPEYDQFRRTYYEEQGVPGLANLPDPREQYRLGDTEVRALLGQLGGTREEQRLAQLRQRESAAEAQSMTVNPVELQGYARRLKAGVPTADYAAEQQKQIKDIGLIGYLTGNPERPLRQAAEAAARSRETVARRLQQNLLAQGRTPYEDAMRGLLGYAVTEAAPAARRGSTPPALNPRITI